MLRDKLKPQKSERRAITSYDLSSRIRFVAWRTAVLKPAVEAGVRAFVHAMASRPNHQCRVRSGADEGCVARPTPWQPRYQSDSAFTSERVNARTHGGSDGSPGKSTRQLRNVSCGSPPQPWCPVHTTHF